MTVLQIKMETRGPLFKGQAGRFGKDARDAAVKDLVEMGENRLDTMLRPRPKGVYLSVGEAGKGKASKGHYRRNLSGVARGGQGRISDGGVEYGPWLEGTGSRNLTTRFKGYHSFRKVGQWLDRHAKKVLDGHVKRAVRRARGSG
tara:strand:+ start:1845 stop:2279 length:435 start_codon:yes stop_codon:yes gene_type:complete